MSRFLLDTTVLIEFATKVPAVQQRVLTLLREGHVLGVSPVSIAEYYSGAELGNDLDMDRFIAGIACWDNTREIALQAGAYRHSFRTLAKKKLPVADTLIAATARHHRATLVTGNPRDFPMRDILIEPLSASLR